MKRMVEPSHQRLLRLLVSWTIFVGFRLTHSQCDAFSVGTSITVSTPHHYQDYSRTTQLRRQRDVATATRIATSTPEESLTMEDSSWDDGNDDDCTTTTTFADLGLGPELLTAVKSQSDWNHPTPVQRLAIPTLLKLGISRTSFVPSSSSSTTSSDFDDYTMADDDEHNLEYDDSTTDSIWCEAPTGSGKTAAYALPLLQNLLLQKKKNMTLLKSSSSSSTTTNRNGRISSLILCPTRELAVQIGHVINTLVNNIQYSSSTSSSRQTSKNKKPLEVMVLHGGIPLQPQIANLADARRDGNTIDILVATPGRLVDVLTHYSLETENDTDGDDNLEDNQGRRRRRTAKDSALERRLLEALDQKGSTDSSLSLEQIEALKLDSIIDEDVEARANLINLLDGLEYLVLDEADRLLGRTFASELDSVLDLLPKNTKLPLWMFSATFPKAIEPRLDQCLSKVGSRTPLRISCASSDRLIEEDEEVSGSLQKKLERTSTVSNAARIQRVGPASTIHLRSIRLNKTDRTQALRKLLDDHPEWDRVLVFVGTRYSTEHVTSKLRRAGIKAMELHGKLDQEARTRRLSDFKRGKYRVMLTTDVASRGIDIAGLPVVFNYDLPRSTSDFIHRVGRTGRAGKQGTAITFVTAMNEAHMELIEQRHLAQPIEREILSPFHPNDDKWEIESEASKISVPGTIHSQKGLAHDRMFGGIKGRRKSKKDKLREAAARQATKPTV